MHKIPFPHRLVLRLAVLVGVTILAGAATVLASGTATSVPEDDALTTTPAPEEPLEITFGDPVTMAGCTAMQNCSDGSTISCTGWDICQVFSTSVKCDDTTVVCPSTGCSVSTVCCDGRRISCSGEEECVKIEGRRVLCDGGASGGGFCPFCQEPI